jgi:hypothetical protein
MHASLIATLVLVISTFAPALSAPLEYAVVPLYLATLSDVFVVLETHLSYVRLSPAHTKAKRSIRVTPSQRRSNLF